MHGYASYGYFIGGRNISGKKIEVFTSSVLEQNTAIPEKGEVTIIKMRRSFYFFNVIFIKGKIEGLAGPFCIKCFVSHWQMF